MTEQPQGRRGSRVAERAPRGLLLAVVTVLLTVGALAVAGAVPESAGPRPAGEPPAQISGRTFVCTAGIEDAELVRGSGVGRKVETRKLAEPVRLDADGQRARDSFALQVVRGADRLALGRCPEPANEWWFVGAGAGVRHSTTLVVDNPRAGEAVFDIEVLGPRGPVEAPGLRGVTLPGGATRSFDLSKVAGSVGNLAAHVTTSRGLVSVGAADRFAVGRLGATTAREWLPDQGAARRQVTLVGLPAQPDRAELLVANPGQVDSVVEVELVGEKGPFAPRGGESVTVAPGSVARVDLTGAFDGTAAAVRLTAESPVVGTVRSLRGGDTTFATAATALQGSSAFGVPAAGNRRVVLTALARDASYRLVTYDGAGKELDRKPVRTEAETTTAVPLPGRVRFARLVGARPDAVAGLLVTGGGVGAVAIPPALRAVKLPVVRPGW